MTNVGNHAAPRNAGSAARVRTLVTRRKGAPHHGRNRQGIHDREVSLTPRAVAALERVAPAEGGEIFGEHKAWRYLADVAATVLTPGKAAIFTGQHFRSAAITRWLES